ncbi:MAG: GNAT family N-acetyltransferase [Flavobacteriales bacterium]|nr:GNAT family N-acetyltransferase [Flavobacteriales bacterium]
MSVSIVSDKSAYLQFISGQANPPIFSQPWYLNIVCGADRWNCALVQKKEEIIGSMAYFQTKEFGQSAIVNTKLQPYTCVLVDIPDNMKGVSAKSRENEVLTAIADGLPKVDRVNIKLYHNVTNWLPFRWNGYHETTFYTYVIPKGTSAEEARMQFRSSVRSTIKKARKTLTATQDVGIDQMIEFGQKTFAAKGKKYPNDPEIIRQLFAACSERNCGMIRGAVDETGKLHSVIFLVEDAGSVYYLLSGSDPELRNSGAVSLLLEDAIVYAMEAGKEFNFEGSMDRGIESFFRSFGGVQVPLMKISKNRTWLMILYDLFKRR